nr:TPA_asm: ATP8 [Bombus superbus]
MPQMMPINWLIIFLLCLMSLFLMMIMINSLMMIYNFKNKYIQTSKLKWNWSW